MMFALRLPLYQTKKSNQKEREYQQQDISVLQLKTRTMIESQLRDVEGYKVTSVLIKELLFDISIALLLMKMKALSTPHFH